MRELLVIAYSVAELATAVDHIKALERAGVGVPYDALGRVQRELNAWVFEWVRREGPDFQPVNTDEIVLTARRYLADNLTHLSELLNESDEVDEQAEDRTTDEGGPT